MFHANVGEIKASLWTLTPLQCSFKSSVKSVSDIRYHDLEIKSVVLNLCLRGKHFSCGIENLRNKYEAHSSVITKIIAF